MRGRGGIQVLYEGRGKAATAVRSVPGKVREFRHQTFFSALVDPQLPALLRRPGDLADRHLDADVAQAWLVLALTGSGTALGIVVALQTLPMLLLGPYGGRDRRPHGQAQADGRRCRH